MKLPCSSTGQDIIVDDGNKDSVSFSPLAWMESHDRGLYGKFTAQSYHYTYSPGATVTFSFNGTYVAYYADLNNDHGAFLASIDGAPGLMGTSFASTWSRTPRLLFSAHVPPGLHKLTITNAANPNTRLAVGVDSFVYRVAGEEPFIPPTIYTGEGPEPPQYSPYIPSKHVPAATSIIYKFADAPASGPPVHATVGPTASGTPQAQRTCAIPALIGLSVLLFVCCVVALVMLVKARGQVRRMKMQLLMLSPTFQSLAEDLKCPPYYEPVPQSAD